MSVMLTEPTQTDGGTGPRDPRSFVKPEVWDREIELATLAEVGAHAGYSPSRCRASSTAG
ncbi:hypothetical protein SAMN05216371_8215 [Streptomyces sp. TLI_053]|uniref:hypothetical protein n=1 Tax=Streptomyces sp. TLI_053 TaxID=1855352 RepID=UPI00087A4C7D|nr:hypothetical protein [Streptomyces sp. TLI_053]SDT83392.1 hypothetical protein SAMN05216371_8215 [Streptomyces sp. TLI_053]